MPRKLLVQARDTDSGEPFFQVLVCRPEEERAALEAAADFLASHISELVDHDPEESQVVSQSDIPAGWFSGARNDVIACAGRIYFPRTEM
jgi:hypothetical protein